MPSNVIAIDGPAASGKSTAARMLAARLNVPYVSTGSLYRALAWKFMKKGIPTETPAPETLARELASTGIAYERASGNGAFEVRIDGVFPGEELRSAEVSKGASDVAKLPEVRAFLLDFQRSFANGPQMIVMEGRDIGTEIFPGAKYKFFLTAAPEVRAKRRLLQDGGLADPKEVERVAKLIRERDRQDMTRATAPLKQADDAITVDNSSFSLDETLAFFLARISPADGGKRPTVLRYRVPYADTDAMGVVYYANYLKYFEMFRTEFMIAAGCSYKKMEESGFALPVVESGCVYKHSARFEDTVEITGRVTECAGVRIRIECEIRCEGRLLARGFTVHACVDRKTMRPVRVPPFLIAMKQ